MWRLTAWWRGQATSRWRRLLGLLVQTLIVLLGATLLVFWVVRLVPGDPARAALGPQATPGEVAQLHRDLGLDKPFFTQYWRWLDDALHGDLGRSIRLSDPVATLIRQRLGVTMELSALALLFSVLVAMPASIVAARWKGAAADRASRLAALAGIAVPSFWLALLLILAFQSVLPIFGYVPWSQGVWAHLSHMILPSVALGAGYTALIFEVNRVGLIEAVQEEYVRTARAHGISERRIYLRYALRNAFLPTLTVIGVQVGLLLGGALLVEKVFAIPGMGRLIIDAVTNRDYPLVQGGVLITVLIFVVVNLLVDALYTVVDPRVRRRTYV